MPRTTKREKRPTERLAPVPDEILDHFAPDRPMTAEEIDAAGRRLKKALMERMLGGELSYHLGYPPGGTKPDDTTNHRNGTSEKRVLTDDGPMAVEIPRDRDGTFEPQLIPKHARRLAGFDDKVLALYARGLTVREIQKFVAEIYSIEVSPDLISEVTDAVVAEVTAWQARPLEPMYPVVFFDALRVKIRDESVVRSKAVYLALAVLPDGTRDILGIWIEQTEGAKFWLKVFNDLKTRGCADILIAVTDGLKGMSEALAVAYPRTTLQTCLVHLIRNSLDSGGLAGPQGARGGAARDLHGRLGRRRERGAGRVRGGPVGPALSDDREDVAPGVGARHPVLRVSARGAARDLHDERARERARARPQDHQDARPLSDRRGGDQADLARAPQHHRRLGRGPPRTGKPPSINSRSCMKTGS